MGDLPETTNSMKELQSQRKRLAEEVVYLKEELRVATMLKSRKRLSLRRQLKRKVTNLKKNRENMKLERKIVDRSRELKAMADEAQRELAETVWAETKAEIVSAFAFHCRRFHARIACRMKSQWLDLFHDLLTECDRDEMKDIDWWEEKHHRELFVHLQALGFRKDQWTCTFQYASSHEITKPLFLLPYYYRNQDLDKHRELLNSEGANKALSPEEREVFAILLKEHEAHQFD